ncbi:MAG: hypothetical protein A2284_00675 [Deltaproteobacteria bacterium RIFOXYA12_FULL_61_11]|nr:MAG: hypothetical protein A2284_00675 [Deltaproteobacteria bacterium RIFOXYA12_FULL_61_11]
MAKRATVTVTKGKEKGRKVVLEPSTCKVIGRRIDLGSLGNDQTVIVKDRLDLREDEILKINSILLANKIGQFEDFSKLESSFRRTGDFILDDESISRLHAMVFHTGEYVGIIDLASTNGTIVDGAKIEVARLAEGSTIRLGGTSMVFNETEL